MRKLLPWAGLLLLGGCEGSLADAELRSGADAKRSGATVLGINTPRTDEVSFPNQDRTDWYVVDLRGRPGVLTTIVHWDNEKSDLMVDVFDNFGAQIAASPTRSKNAKEKKLLTQIDKPGTYFLRLTAPGRKDGSVYTMEAKWEAPDDKPLPIVMTPTPSPEPRAKPREPREPRERPTGNTVQGRVVAAYREGAGLTLQLDKGASAGLKVGMSGSVLSGASGESELDGGSFKITQVLGENKSVAHCGLNSIGKNTRFVVSVGR